MYTIVALKGQFNYVSAQGEQNLFYVSTYLGIFVYSRSCATVEGKTNSYDFRLHALHPKNWLPSGFVLILESMSIIGAHNFTKKIRL